MTGLFQEAQFVISSKLPIRVERFKLTFEQPAHVAAHGVADHPGSLDPVAVQALESAERVTRWCGCSAGQVRQPTVWSDGCTTGLPDTDLTGRSCRAEMPSAGQY